MNRLNVMKKILVYGFANWGTVKVNISQQIVEGIADFPKLQKRILRVRFDEQLFLDMVNEQQYDYVLGVGRYPRGSKIRIEQLGFNRKKIGKQCGFISTGGVDNYPVTWHIQPLEGMETTNDPGSFVCNFSMYVLGRWASQHAVKYAFLHVPKEFAVKRVIVMIDEILRNQII